MEKISANNCDLEMTITPIFIFSLPRAGSTLLQRILSVHPEIESVSEMWFLLPLVYALKGTGIYAEYSAVSLSNALGFLVKELPHGDQDYYDATRAFADVIYSRLSSRKTNARFYLDKTPRYYLIIDEIVRIFPNAKIIFLFRHPLGILASMINSFNWGKLGDYRHKIDAFRGPFLLANGYSSHRNRSFCLQYETLLTEPEKTVNALCEYLSVDYHAHMLKDFADVPVRGFGDQTGIKKYHNMNKESINSWQKTFSTRYRKNYARKYIKKLGKETLEISGYDINEILAEIQNMPAQSAAGSFGDRVDLIRCGLYSWLEIALFKKKMKESLKTKEAYVHY